MYAKSAKNPCKLVAFVTNYGLFRGYPPDIAVASATTYEPCFASATANVQKGSGNQQTRRLTM